MAQPGSSVCNFTNKSALLNSCDRVTSIVKYVIRIFVLHISIAHPLGESGKLQMASDMTNLEFALNVFISIDNKRGGNLESIGDEYRALRAMR